VDVENINLKAQRNVPVPSHIVLVLFWQSVSQLAASTEPASRRRKYQLVETCNDVGNSRVL